MTSIVLSPDTQHDLTPKPTPEPEPTIDDVPDTQHDLTPQQPQQPEPTIDDVYDDVYNTIIEDELQGFNIVEDENEEDEEDTKPAPPEINSKKDQKIRDLLESLIMFGLFLATYGYDIEEKQKAVMEFCKENKELIDQIILNLERSVAQMPMIYEQLKKLNGWSFIFQLIALFMAFDSFMKNWQKKEQKEHNQEKKEEENINDFTTTTTTTEEKPARLSVF
jgi:hypothetical protein